ncbi:hypothetical protein D3C74_420770 [compost metagenome]
MASAWMIVKADNGTAAASLKERLAGILATIAASTATYSANAPNLSSGGMVYT